MLEWVHSQVFMMFVISSFPLGVQLVLRAFLFSNELSPTKKRQTLFDFPAGWRAAAEIGGLQAREPNQRGMACSCEVDFALRRSLCILRYKWKQQHEALLDGSNNSGYKKCGVTHQVASIRGTKSNIVLVGYNGFRFQCLRISEYNYQQRVHRKITASRITTCTPYDLVYVHISQL